MFQQFYDAGAKAPIGWSHPTTTSFSAVQVNAKSSRSAFSYRPPGSDCSIPSPVARTRAERDAMKIWRIGYIDEIGAGTANFGWFGL